MSTTRNAFTTNRLMESFGDYLTCPACRLLAPLDQLALDHPTCPRCGHCLD